MKNNPFLTSLLIGLIVILIIAGISLLANIKVLRSDYEKEHAKKMSLEKTIEQLREQNSDLENTIDNLNKQFGERVDELNAKIKELELENLKVEKLKDKLEESLKEELMKNKLGER